MNLSHVKLIVYAEEFARKGLSGHINSLISDSNIRPRVSVTVCEGKAKDFLSELSPKLEASPSRYYELNFSTYNYSTQSETSQLIDLYTSFQSIDRNAYATYVKLSDDGDGEKEIELSGIAIFDETAMIDSMEDHNFLLAHSLLTNNLKQSNYAITDFKNDNRFISVRLIQNSVPQITVELSGDAPKINCKINLEAHLVSSGSDINFYNNGNEEKLKEALDKHLEEIINSFFDKTIHEYQVDIAHVGRNAKLNFSTWQEFEEYNWLSKYRNASYDVEVNTKLNISQIISHIIPNTSK